MFIEIDGTRYPCKAETSETQIGRPLVRIYNAPLAEDGFKLISGEKEIDKSDYKYLYNSYGTVKEYTNVPEEIIPAIGYKTGVPESPIEKQFNAVNNRITSITPYTSTKKGYFGEVEKVFYGVPNGIMTVQMDNEFTVQRIEDRVYVRFERLEEAKDITLIVQ